MSKYLLSLILGCIILACSNPTVAGGGMEDGNNGSVVGIVASIAGKPLSNQSVTLVPADSAPTPANIRHAITDSTGSFCAESIPEGSWRIDIMDTIQGAYISDVITVLPKKETDVGAMTLKPTGSILVKVKPSSQPTRTFYFEGTNRAITISGTDTSVLFTDLPEGTIPSLQSTDITSGSFENPVVVADTTTIISLSFTIVYLHHDMGNILASALWQVDSLQAAGFSVLVIDTKIIDTSLLSSVDLIICTETAQLGGYETPLRHMAKPVIVQSGKWASALAICLTVEDFDWGKASTAPIEVSDGMTTLSTAYLTGDLISTPAEGAPWAIPISPAFSAAGIQGDVSKSHLFGIEKGSAIDGLSAPARRGFCWFQQTATPEYAVLLRSLVHWALQQ